MHVRILAMIAAAALLAACSSTPEEVAELKGAGGAQPAMPAPTPPPQQQAMRTAPLDAAGELAQIGDRVLYDTDKSDLSPAARATVDKQAAWMKKYANVSVTIEGHCDERGTREYNLALGERRATATRDYLVSLGVAASRIRIISYGEERPVCRESNESCWGQNRRSHFIVTGRGGA